MQQGVLSKVEQIVSPIVMEEGCELVDAELITEHGSRILRLYIDKPGGVLLGDCQRISHAVEDVLEVEDVITGRYSLEVSSPGLNRPLKTRQHFLSVIDKMVSINAKDKIDGRGRFKGVLKAVNDSEAETVLVVDIDGQDFNIPLTMVAKANLVF